MAGTPDGRGGARLREARLAAGIAQAALAARAGISPSYLNLIEHGRRPATAPLLARLAAALGLEAEALAARTPAAAALRAVAEGRLPPGALDEADALAARHPRWAEMIVDLDGEARRHARAAAALSDRMAHDPVLTDAVHEMLSTASAVRSTASILAGDPDLDATWRARFHASLDAESRRLAAGAEAVAARLEARDAPEPATAEDHAARLFAAHRHRFDGIEADGAAAIPALLEGVPQAARDWVRLRLEAYATDAARLPLHRVDGRAIPDVWDAAGGDGPLVLRRMAVADPDAAFVEVDGAGGIVAARAAAGFPVGDGALCPLWPLWEARADDRPVEARLEMPDGGAWHAVAAAARQAPAGWDAPAPRRAAMLARPADAAGGRAVGPSCPRCPRTCAARRAPPAAGAALDSPPSGAQGDPAG
ncbi:helix-turn-helix domain-containing protein [Jannaschia sp. Os4]|uniref:helix-turn-helix domain-containing protein n=1 Tax=Jannaschia sp. Os4 TaxID=2807617 RepID=UPI00193A82F2|nr:helix-turn-helix domain-containing protein [Jannaschia sp. Os4]MBM2577609.1 helix-turn-helix domain-containing protein [Jannaschia sp. Os4]